MPERKRNESGDFETKATPDDVLDVIREHVRESGEPVVTVSDVRHGLEHRGIDVVRETARSRLRDLTDAGDLARKEVGARAVVWYVPGTCMGENR